MGGQAAAMRLSNVSAVLITTCEEYPGEILASLPEFGEVLVSRPENLLGRYEAIRSASGDIIYVQDDDVVVDPLALWERFNGRITNYLTPHHKRYYDELCGQRITLVGFGAFFPKSFLRALDVYAARWGKDFFYHREPDRIFTWLNAPHNAVVTDSIRHLPTAEEPSRLSMHPNHYQYLGEVIQRLRTLEM